MTEAEWERGIERRPMLELLHERMSARKFRLFAVACCRRQGNLVPPIPHRQVIKAAERFADGIGTEEELRTVAEAVRRITSDYAKYTPGMEEWQIASAAEFTVGRSGLPPWENARCTAVCVSRVVSGRVHVYQREFDPDPDPEEYQQITLLHDIAGNPFRPEMTEPNWETSTVVALASQMYGSRDFSAMPILADALQDAGCDNDVILEHCRGPGPHVRGCWVVDLILGKE